MNRLQELWELARELRSNTPKIRYFGILKSISAGRIAISGLSAYARIGDILRFDEARDNAMAEISGIEGVLVYATLLRGGVDLRIGTRVELCGPILIKPSDEWCGRILNGLCEPIDDKGALPQGSACTGIEGIPARPLERGRTGRLIHTGVHAIDMFSPLCLGQRIGIFAGSGVGKSTLLSMLARCGQFDLVVTALVGERIREVREFVEDSLANQLHKSIVIAATAGDPAPLRRLAAMSATTIAEYFRDRGLSVCLLLDSVTRLVHAERDVAISSGEPPVSRGYPPSVFNAVSKLLERSGPGKPDAGSITAFYTILVDGDDHNEPVADHIRGVLDGHIVLSREIAERGRFPAIDILKSISRLATSLWSDMEREKISALKELIGVFEDTRDLRAIGGYAPGADKVIDQALVTVPLLYGFLNQSTPESESRSSFDLLAKHLSQHMKLSQ